MAADTYVVYVVDGKRAEIIGPFEDEGQAVDWDREIESMLGPRKGPVEFYLVRGIDKPH